MPVVVELYVGDGLDSNRSRCVGRALYRWRSDNRLGSILNVKLSFYSADSFSMAIEVDPPAQFDDQDRSLACLQELLVHLYTLIEDRIHYLSQRQRQELAQAVQSALKALEQDDSARARAILVDLHCLLSRFGFQSIREEVEQRPWTRSSIFGRHFGANRYPNRDGVPKTFTVFNLENLNHHDFPEQTIAIWDQYSYLLRHTDLLSAKVRDQYNLNSKGFKPLSPGEYSFGFLRIVLRSGEASAPDSTADFESQLATLAEPISSEKALKRDKGLSAFEGRSQTITSRLLDFEIGELGLCNIHISANLPRVALAGSSFRILLWIHLDQQHRRSNLRESGWKDLKYSDRIQTRITAHTFIESLNVRVDNFTFDWDGGPAICEFLIDVPTNASEKNHAGKITVRINCIVIDTLEFRVSILRERWFMSYSRKDINRVTNCVMTMRVVNQQAILFFDKTTLQLGIDFKKQIETAIRESDLFYLFWSLNAKLSAWVTLERQFAESTAKERGISLDEFIIPIPLQPPEEVEPPEGLEHLHLDAPELHYGNNTAAYGRLFDRVRLFKRNLAVFMIKRTRAYWF